MRPSPMPEVFRLGKGLIDGFEEGRGDGKISLVGTARVEYRKELGETTSTGSLPLS